MGFEAFDTDKLDEYAARAEELWGGASQWADYQEKSADRTRGDEAELGKRLMTLFVPFGKMAAEGADPASAQARAQAALIREFITKHFYACTVDTFAQLGRAYGAGGEFTRNIDAAAGPGAAEFASKVVAAYCADAV